MEEKKNNSKHQKNAFNVVPLHCCLQISVFLIQKRCSFAIAFVAFFLYC